MRQRIIMETADSSTPQGADRRTERRMRTLKSGRIVFNEGRSVFDCVVRNLSPGGALLEIPNMLGIPSRFDVDIERAARRRPCTVRWHTDRLMGVHFDDGQRAA
jgi:PilZ domain